MRSMMILPLVAAFALAACSDGGADADGDGEITAEEAAAEAAEGGNIAMEAGEWEQSIKFTELDIPGMPPEMKEMALSQMGSGRTVKTCLTQEQANQPDADFFGAAGQDGCKYQEFDRSGNRMTVHMTCDGGASGGTMDMKLTGEFSSNSFNMAMDSKVTGSGSGDMTMKGTVTGKRIGDCPGA